MSTHSQLQPLSMSRVPSKEEMEVVAAGLHEYGRLATAGRFDFPGSEDPGLVIERAVRGPSGEIVGGVSTSSILGVMWLETLWVSEAYRRRGLASWLVLEAERSASEEGCIGAGTWTFSWQGVDFYPTLGYMLRGVYRGYPFGVTEHVLTKRLPNPASQKRLAAQRLTLEGAGFDLVGAPTQEEMRIVHRGLHTFCRHQAGEEMDYPGICIRLTLRDQEGRTVGGLDSYTTIRVMALEAVWIDERYRGEGYGRQLLLEAERVAKESGCMAVNTHCLSFQSPGFFRRMGYEVFGTVDVYVDGYTEDLLIKKL
jgi:GNAT superfamily N-acetyltransferase